MIKKMLNNFEIEQFQTDLLSWYKKNKRDLPWRHTNDPYRIWVSEIMLQQTQVDTVIPYYNRFINKFPTPYELASADEQTVLKEWEGLGYYSRARNLHAAVREVVTAYDGRVPSNPKELGSLKGIGPYTRGAILSIAFNQPEPAVDGNVMRVLSRVLLLEDDIALQRVRKMFEDIVYQIISVNDPSSFNQGLMELGALICTPKKPVCLHCPVREHCRAFEKGVEEQLPIKSRGKKQKKLPYVVLLMKNKEQKYAIEQRGESGLLANLWQFPMVPIEEIGMDHVEHWIFGEYGLEIALGEKKGKLKHVFSHLIWELMVYEAKIIRDDDTSDHPLRFVTKEEMQTYPFPVSHLKMMPLLFD